MDESWGESLFIALWQAAAVFAVYYLVGGLLFPDSLTVADALWFGGGWFIGAVIGRRVTNSLW